jgi:hypothetical protein
MLKILFINYFFLIIPLKKNSMRVLETPSVAWKRRCAGV